MTATIKPLSEGAVQEAVRRHQTLDVLAPFTLTCDRGAASQIDWNNVDAKGLKTLCNSRPQVRNM